MPLEAWPKKKGGEESCGIPLYDDLNFFRLKPFQNANYLFQIILFKCVILNAQMVFSVHVNSRISSSPAACCPKSILS